MTPYILLVDENMAVHNNIMYLVDQMKMNTATIQATKQSYSFHINC
jgi:hypothetical protein